MAKVGLKGAWPQKEENEKLLVWPRLRPKVVTSNAVGIFEANARK